MANKNKFSFNLTDKRESHVILLFSNHELSFYLINNKVAKNGTLRLDGIGKIFRVGLSCCLFPIVS